MTPQDKERINRMLSFAIDVVEMSEGITLDKLTDCKPLQYSLLYPLGQIGELAIKADESARNRGEKIEEVYPDIEWADWRGFRNRVFHDYGAIDFKIILEMIMEAIPILITGLTSINNNSE